MAPTDTTYRTSPRPPCEQPNWLDRLGVVVPALNAQQFLPDTLQSLQKLIACGAKLIVVDGGSTDHTHDICRKWRAPLLVDKTPGLYHALNVGFESLKTPWLTWINADDLLFSSGLLRYSRDMEDADVHYGAVDFIDSDGRFLHSWQSAAPHDLIRLFRAGLSPLLQQGTVFKRAVFEKTGGFNSSFKYVADADFWWNALNAGFRFRRLSNPPVAAFRLHERQLSHINVRAMKAEHTAMVQKRLGRSRGPLFASFGLGYRLANTSRYLVRLLRQKDVSGRFHLPGSYDLP